MVITAIFSHRPRRSYLDSRKLSTKGATLNALKTSCSLFLWKPALTTNIAENLRNLRNFPAFSEAEPKFPNNESFYRFCFILNLNVKNNNIARTRLGWLWLASWPHATPGWFVLNVLNPRLDMHSHRPQQETSNHDKVCSTTLKPMMYPPCCPLVTFLAGSIFWYALLKMQYLQRKAQRYVT